MPNKMLIDATHPEETRVVVLRGHRVEEFDFESASRKQLRGNIYLAKVTRVEPSLQAAFIDYGGNRHGFLAFSEIHPDYYQIPIADRQALIAEEERAQRAAEAEADRRAGRRNGERGRASERAADEIRSEPIDADLDTVAMAAASEQMAPAAEDAFAPDAAHAEAAHSEAADPDADAEAEAPPSEPARAAAEYSPETPVDLNRFVTDVPVEPATAADDLPVAEGAQAHEPLAPAEHDEPGEQRDPAEPAEADNLTEIGGNGSEGEEEIVESVGGADAMEEVPERSPRIRRQYKIQEVIKRRQVMLVQVVKEERGTKGAALTTYLSLAGRYSVLMPNTARGGGISRKITSAEDRRRLKEIAQDLEVPEGMGVILRTAGAARTKTEVKRDFEYLLRLWETVRDLTLKSTAPTLVYEEGSLVKRSIRDLYNKDIDEILVAGEPSYTEAKDFMRMLMPSHAKNVKSYPDGLPIFTRYGIESQLDAMFTPVVQLRSGGYIVLNQTEALVAIDVNSGRATREHHIEDTALKTNMEAAEEIARQLRLRDLAGLIVIDFIDMDEKRNNRSVERRLKECLRHDRARIQVGHISHFGLLEMSRQRIRSSVLESSTEKCPHCGGTGHVRSVSSVALQLLRSLEESLLKGATHNLTVRTRTEIALYLLNQKRAHLRALEERFRITILVSADAAVGGQVSFLIERNEQVHSPEQAKAIAAAQPPSPAAIEEEEEDVVEEEDDDDDDVQLETEAGSETALEAEQERDEEAAHRQDSEQGNGRRRRRRRRGRRGEARESAPPPPDHVGADESGAAAAGLETADGLEQAEGEDDGEEHAPSEGAAAAEANGERRRRRRGRRGGRRNRRERGEEAAESTANEPQHAIVDVADVGFTSPVEPGAEAHEPAARIDHEPPPSPTEAAIEPAHHVPITQAGPPEPPIPTEPPPMVESPRRRSTVREPAPVAMAADVTVPTPAVAPAMPSLTEPTASNTTEGEADDRPRRSGWWSRRVLGKG